VREGVQALVADTPPLSPPDYPHSNFAPSSGWRELDDEYEELRRWEENLAREQELHGTSEVQTQAPAREPAQEPARLRRALPEGLQAASWWLRRGGGCPILTALS